MAGWLKLPVHDRAISDRSKLTTSTRGRGRETHTETNLSIAQTGPLLAKSRLKARRILLKKTEKRIDDSNPGLRRLAWLVSYIDDECLGFPPRRLPLWVAQTDYQAIHHYHHQM